MSYRKRKIPVLLLSNRKLVKTVRFKNPNYLGDPINAVRIFSTKNADEILICDISRTPVGEGPEFGYLREVTEEAMVPVSYVGGVRSTGDFEKLVEMGFEKVGMDSFAWKDNGQTLRDAVDMFGSSTVIAGCTVRRRFGRFIAVESQSLRSLASGQSLQARLGQLESLGVGEIFVNYVNGDGTFQGMQDQLVESIPEDCRCNVVVCGGIRDFDELDRLLEFRQIDAVAAGSAFVYDGPNRGIMIDYPKRLPIP